MRPELLQRQPLAFERYFTLRGKPCHWPCSHQLGDYLSSWAKSPISALSTPSRGDRDHRQLHPASEAFLDGLTRSPHNDFLQRAFEEQVLEFKTEQVVRWSRWPFHIPPAARATARAKKQKLEPPDSMYGHLEGVGATSSTVEVVWDPHELRHENDRIDGYELEAAEVSFLDGEPGPWKRVYRGDMRHFMVSGLLAESEVIVRVRAFNRRGEGEWSDEVTLRTGVEEEQQLQEITEIPPAWRHLDLQDICGGDPVFAAEGGGFPAVMDQLCDVMTTHQKEIKIAFRYFTLMGGANNTEDLADAMGQQQFVACIKQAKLIDKKLITSDCDRIFLRAIRATENIVGLFGGEENKLAMKLKKAMSKAGNMMHQHQFCAGLVRLAHAKWPHIPSTAARLEKLLSEFFHDMVYKDLQLVSDDFSEMIGTPLFKAVLRKHEEKMSIIFNYFAGVDQSLNAQSASATMNVKEMGDLCEDAGFYDDHFSVRHLVAAFVKVNIDDELYVQEDEDNTSTELVFDEFQELVARMFNEREWGHPDRPTLDGRERAEDLERGFDEWLGAYFVPGGLAAIKARKKANR